MCLKWKCHDIGIAWDFAHSGLWAPILCLLKKHDSCDWSFKKKPRLSVNILLGLTSRNERTTSKSCFGKNFFKKWPFHLPLGFRHAFLFHERSSWRNAWQAKISGYGSLMKRNVLHIRKIDLVLFFPPLQNFLQWWSAIFAKTKGKKKKEEKERRKERENPCKNQTNASY